MDKLKTIAKNIYKIFAVIGVPVLIVIILTFMLNEWWEYLIFGIIIFGGIIVGILENLGTWRWSRFYE